jgi:hypothetical protein
VKAAELLGFGFALVVGWTDPEGARPWLGAVLLAYHDPNERLVYAGCVFLSLVRRLGERGRKRVLYEVSYRGLKPPRVSAVLGRG